MPRPPPCRNSPDAMEGQMRPRCRMRPVSFRLATFRKKQPVRTGPISQPAAAARLANRFGPGLPKQEPPTRPLLAPKRRSEGRNPFSDEAGPEKEERVCLAAAENCAENFHGTPVTGARGRTRQAARRVHWRGKAKMICGPGGVLLPR